MTIILKCEQLEGRHTGEVVAKNLTNTLKDWGLSMESVHCMLRDRGSNMIKAMKIAIHMMDMDNTQLMSHTKN